VGLGPDLKLQVLDVLLVVLAQPLASAARALGGLVAGRRRRGLRDVHRHRRHLRLCSWTRFGFFCFFGFLVDERLIRRAFLLLAPEEESFLFSARPWSGLLLGLGFSMFSVL
jgi:hypothetical protein